MKVNRIECQFYLAGTNIYCSSGFYHTITYFYLVNQRFSIYLKYHELYLFFFFFIKRKTKIFIEYCWSTTHNLA